MNFLRLSLVRASLMFLLVLGLSGCATPNVQQKNFTISNLRVGKVCGLAGKGHICEQTYDIVVNDRGTCVYNRQLRHCTWYGFSFSYSPIVHDINLELRVTSDVPNDVGNPKQVIAHHVKSSVYHFVLPKGSTHFFNPQYVSGWRPGRSVTAEKETCTYRGRVLFEFTVRFHAPTAGS